MTTEPFADEHAIIDAAQRRICAAEEQIYAPLARIPKPPGAITCKHDDESMGLLRAGGRVHAPTSRWATGPWPVMSPAASAPKSTCASSRPIPARSREWRIYLDGHGFDGMTAEGARRLAAALLEAAAALEASRSHHSEPDA